MARKRINASALGLFAADAIRILGNNKFVDNISVGLVNKEPLLLFVPHVLQEGPRVLIAGGFHGNEIAGSLSIFRYLAQQEEPEDGINVAFLPVVSMSAFKQHTRFNEWGENANRGFCKPSLSREGLILQQQSDLLGVWAQHGCLTLHEDVGETKFYAYTMEISRRLSKALRRTGSKFFPLKKRGTADGIIQDDYANSFEDLWHNRGTPWIACTETPARLPLERRIQAGVALIKTFCRVVKKAHKA